MRKRDGRTGPSQSASQGGMALPHLEAGVWIYPSALTGLGEESRLAAGGLHPGKPLPAPQTAGPPAGVVSLESAKTPSRDRNEAARRTILKSSRKVRTHAAKFSHSKVGILRRGSLEDCLAYSSFNIARVSIPLHLYVSGDAKSAV